MAIVFYFLELIEKALRILEHLFNNFKVVKSVKFISLLILFSIVINYRHKAIANHESGIVCPANLDEKIEAIINRPEWQRSDWGILIQSLDGNDILYSLDAEKYFTVASNVKLLTTAAALLKLGSRFRIYTPVYAIGSAPDLKVLTVVGKGDPSFSDRQLEVIAQNIKHLGIDRIATLVVRDNYFAQANINSSWEWSDLYSYYGTSVNSLILNENKTTLTLTPGKLGRSIEFKWSDFFAARQWQIENKAITVTENTPYNIKINAVYGRSLLQINGQLAINSQPDIWDLAIVDPANYFLESLRSRLLQEGIKVDRGLVLNDRHGYSLGKIITAIKSPRSIDLIRISNQKSNNLYAEALLKILGDRSQDITGLESVKATLSKLGVDRESYSLVDGSGLSRHNLVSPEALVTTLKLIAKTKEAENYRSSLSIAGVNGTLQKRFVHTKVQGNLAGKTGTLTGVAALSGYLNVPDYQPLVFSIIIDRSDRSGSELRQAIDEIVLLLSRLSFCGSTTKN